MAPRASDPSAERPPRSLRLDALRVGLLVAAVCGHGLWIASLAANWGQPELLRRDFIVLHHAAQTAPEALYTAPLHDGPGAFPFLHPPPVAALARLLTEVSPLGIYLGVIGLNALALGLLLWLLLRLRQDPETRDVLVLAALASAPWLIQLTLGQPAAVWPMLWVSGLSLSRRRPLLAGLIWSLTGLKPVFLVGALALAALSGRRCLVGVALGIAGLVIVSLTLGGEVWLDWLAAIGGASAAASHGAVLFKQHTVRASLVWLSVPYASVAAWALSAGLGGWTLAVAWRRRGEPFFLLSILALATVVLSPYLYFYDAFLLIVPAAYRWRTGHTSAAAWVAVALFLLHPAVYFGLQSGAPFGLIAAAWLVLELLSPVTEGHEVGSSVPVRAQ
ncbi:MAG: glycosyltransferase 87 family protein [Sandaracinaceae bacterium]